MNIELYIENQKIDLSNEIDYTLNKSWGDLLDPTVIKNDYSKTIEVPFTPVNNKIFGNLYRLDQQQQLSPTSSIGLYFNPHKKLDCYLSYNSKVIFRGYAKMNSITNTATKHTYNINIFGGIGKIFDEMKKMVWGESKLPQGHTEEDKKYVIPNFIESSVIGEPFIINKNTAKSLLTDRPDYEHMGRGVFSGNNMGLALTDQGLYEDFSSDTFLGGYNDYNDFWKFRTFESWLTGDPKTTQEHERGCGLDEGTAKAIVGDGINEHTLREYRSYYQQPYLYTKALFEKIIRRAGTVTGYTFNLDPEWFSESNPYWADSVYLLDNVSFNKDIIQTPHKLTLKNNLFWSSSQIANNAWAYPNITSDYSFVSVIPPDKLSISQDKNLLPSPGYNTHIAFDGTLLSEEAGHKNSTPRPIVYSRSQIKDLLKIEIQIYVKEGAYVPADHSESPINTYYFKPVKVCCGGTAPGYTRLIEYRSGVNYIYKLPDNVRIDLGVVNIYEYIEKFHLRVKLKCSYNKVPNLSRITFDFDETSESDLNKLYVRTDRITRSGAVWDSETLMGDDISPYEWFMRYIKMYNLIVYEEPISKTVYIRTYNNMFRYYDILDWSNKVDRKDNFNIQPIIFDKKYVKFNYKDNDSKFGERFKSEFGYNYSEKVLSTSYSFNDETKDLFKDINYSVPVKGIPYGRLEFNTVPPFIIRNFPLLLMNKTDKENKKISIPGVFAFRDKNKSGVDSYVVSDDCTEMQSKNNYCYYSREPSQGIILDKYVSSPIKECPVITDYLPSKNGKNFYSTFNLPAVGYGYRPPTFGAYSIYDICWKNYLQELYDPNNYKLTCNLNITPLDYENFKFSNFVIIDNVLFFLYKIIDYNPSSTSSTKCELIKVTNINNYINNGVIPGAPRPTPVKPIN